MGPQFHVRKYDTTKELVHIDPEQCWVISRWCSDYCYGCCVKPKPQYKGGRCCYQVPFRMHSPWQYPELHRSRGEIDLYTITNIGNQDGRCIHEPVFRMKWPGRKG